LPAAKNCWNSGSFERNVSKLTSTSIAADPTSAIAAIMAGTEKSQPKYGSSRSSIRSGSIPRKRIDITFDSHAIHCFQIRCLRRSKSCGPCPGRSPMTSPERWSVATNLASSSRPIRRGGNSASNRSLSTSRLTFPSSMLRRAYSSGRNRK